jgi:hypothetical protein
MNDDIHLKQKKEPKTEFRRAMLVFIFLAILITAYDFYKILPSNQSQLAAAPEAVSFDCLSGGVKSSTTKIAGIQGTGDCTKETKITFASPDGKTYSFLAKDVLGRYLGCEGDSTCVAVALGMSEGEANSFLGELQNHDHFGDVFPNGLADIELTRSLNDAFGQLSQLEELGVPKENIERAKEILKRSSAEEIASIIADDILMDLVDPTGTLLLNKNEVRTLLAKSAGDVERLWKNQTSPADLEPRELTPKSETSKIRSNTFENSESPTSRVPASTEKIYPEDKDFELQRLSNLFEQSRINVGLSKKYDREANKVLRALTEAKDIGDDYVAVLDRNISELGRDITAMREHTPLLSDTSDRAIKARVKYNDMVGRIKTLEANRSEVMRATYGNGGYESQIETFSIFSELGKQELSLDDPNNTDPRYLDLEFYIEPEASTKSKSSFEVEELAEREGEGEVFGDYLSGAFARELQLQTRLKSSAISERDRARLQTELNTLENNLNTLLTYHPRPEELDKAFRSEFDQNIIKMYEQRIANQDRILKAIDNRVWIDSSKRLGFGDPELLRQTASADVLSQQIERAENETRFRYIRGGETAREVALATRDAAVEIADGVKQIATRSNTLNTLDGLSGNLGEQVIYKPVIASGEDGSNKEERGLLVEKKQVDSGVLAETKSAVPSERSRIVPTVTGTADARVLTGPEARVEVERLRAESTLARAELKAKIESRDERSVIRSWFDWIAGGASEEEAIKTARAKVERAEDTYLEMLGWIENRPLVPNDVIVARGIVNPTALDLEAAEARVRIASTPRPINPPKVIVDASGRIAPNPSKLPTVITSDKPVRIVEVAPKGDIAKTVTAPTSVVRSSTQSTFPDEGEIKIDTKPKPPTQEQNPNQIDTEKQNPIQAGLGTFEFSKILGFLSSLFGGPGRASSSSGGAQDQLNNAGSISQTSDINQISNDESLRLVANPSSVNKGEQGKVGWITAGARNCTVSASKGNADEVDAFNNAHQNVTQVNGTADTPPLSEDMEIVVKCKMHSGEDKEERVTVKVR